MIYQFLISLTEFCISLLTIAMISNNQDIVTSGQFTIVGLGTVAIEFAVAVVLCFKAHTIARFFTIEHIPEAEE